MEKQRRGRISHFKWEKDRRSERSVVREERIVDWKEGAQICETQMRKGREVWSKGEHHELVLCREQLCFQCISLHAQQVDGEVLEESGEGLGGGFLWEMAQDLPLALCTINAPYFFFF